MKLQIFQTSLFYPNYFILDEIKYEYPAINTLLVSQLISEVDSKAFVDMPSRRNLESIEEDFTKILVGNDILVPTKDLEKNNINAFYENLNKMPFLKTEVKNNLKSFLGQNFYEPGSDLSPHIPVDFREENNLKSKISNPEIRKMVDKLNYTMRDLCREKKNILNSESTLLNLKYPFFVPGGRFREFYYWDTYWILKGILALDMKDSALNILNNFIDVINQYGHFPNGTRTYYLNRSQIPYFPLMLLELYNYPFFKEKILKEGLPAALKEYNYFKKNFLPEYNLNFYKVESKFPRLESFKEDLSLYKNSTDIFTETKSVAESGWDFSSRWLFDKIKITNLFPTDLNSILYINEVIIAFLLNEIGDLERSKKFSLKAFKRKNSIKKFLFDKTGNEFRDYNFISKTFKKGFYASNMYPLIYFVSEKKKVYEILLQNFEYIFGQIGGIPASNVNSSEQWDFPNVWAPYTEALENFLYNMGEITLSKHIASTFFMNAYVAYKKNDVFYEKYLSFEIGSTGKGGEYIPQEGFGWTNGTLLSFIKKYGDELMEFNFDESRERCLEILRKKVEQNSKK